MDIFFHCWYELHSNILQLQVSILECRIMGSEIKFLDREHLGSVCFSLFFCLLQIRLMFLPVEVFLPSNQRGNNRNTHLYCLQMLDNFSGLLHIQITILVQTLALDYWGEVKFIPSAKRELAGSKLVTSAPTPNRSGLLLQWPRF